MTIAMAAICDAKNETQTGSVLLCTDTRLSWGLDTSNEGGSKLYDLPHGLFMALAGDVSRAHQFNGYLYANLREIEANDPAFVERVRLAIDRANDECMVWARRETVHEFGITEEEFFSKFDISTQKSLGAAIKEAVQKIQVLIAGHSPYGAPMIFYTDGVSIAECATPGFTCIGSGTSAALHWLNFRNQNSFMSTQRTYYHLREAHAFSKLSIGVGDICHMLLLRHNLPPADIGVNVPLLNSWAATFFPRKTDQLDAAEAAIDFFTAYDL